MDPLWTEKGEQKVRKEGQKAESTNRLRFKQDYACKKGGEGRRKKEVLEKKEGRVTSSIPVRIS